MYFIIKNCKMLMNGKEVVRNIYISGGKIDSIRQGMPEQGSYTAFDANYNFVIPGLIDPHVHLREPGLTHKEDILTGSMAAAAGGITTFFDMPNTQPPTLARKDLDDKKELAKDRSYVNYSFYIGAAVYNADEVKRANKEYDLPGTKLFMNQSTGNMRIDDNAAIMKIFQNSRLVAVHAEGEKVEEAIKYAKATGTKLYLCHISTAEEINVIRRYRKMNEWVKKNVFVEVTPHHLFMTEKDYEAQGAFAKMIPSLKTKKDQDALWKAIDDGIVTTIGTDHAPHTVEEKRGSSPPGGVPGEETMLPLMLNAMNEGRITLEKIVELTSKNPARIFGIKGRGMIVAGQYADLTIIDADLEKEVKNDELSTKCGWSPFNGSVLKGWPVTTIVNGNIVFDHGKFYKPSGKEVLFK